MEDTEQLEILDKLISSKNKEILNKEDKLFYKSEDIIFFLFFFVIFIYLFNSIFLYENTLHENSYVQYIGFFTLNFVFFPFLYFNKEKTTIKKALSVLLLSLVSTYFCFSFSSSFPFQNIYLLIIMTVFSFILYLSFLSKKTNAAIKKQKLEIKKLKEEVVTNENLIKKEIFNQFNLSFTEIDDLEHIDFIAKENDFRSIRYLIKEQKEILAKNHGFDNYYLYRVDFLEKTINKNTMTNI